ncbi:probable ATP-dependent RNA helicase DDX59 [Antedon mediterranea]|uniref:probable ATP-dependent RNA helicase DDX59 n=1 Tax=Antedon mediterranea TaxID=105859 RepID=UPI003AF421CC
MFVPRSLKVASTRITKPPFRKQVSNTANLQTFNTLVHSEAKKDTVEQSKCSNNDDNNTTNTNTDENEMKITLDHNQDSFDLLSTTIPSEDDDMTNNTIHYESQEDTNTTVKCRPSIKSYSKEQRFPASGEPVCVICGRYGEYICDQTDADVCSLECKARNLARTKQSIDEDATVDNSSDQYHQDDDADSDQDLLDMGPSRCTAGYAYREHPTLASLTKEQVHELRNQVSIFVEGLNIPKPIIEFSHLSLPKTMAHNLKKSEYKSPTPVQMQVIPAALLNHDLMVCAQTSSGKTASFLIPSTLLIYNEVHEKEQKYKPIVIILTPTRELAMQIESQAKQIMKGLQNMKTALIVGGLPMPPQIHRLQQGVQLVIATPGRLLDLIAKEEICLDHIKLLVVDEVDSMLQMGFQDQVMNIMKELEDDHQTMLFSATIPKATETLASTLLHNPIYISIGTPSTPSSSVKHTILWVEDPSKKKKLFGLLQDPKHYKPPLVIFVDSKLGCEMLSQTIKKICGYKVATLHGDKTQVERSQTLQHFLESAFPIMVCTSVLGRGIDLVGVKLVINFDMPNTVEEYIHQIGRTGRLGGKGTAITFINNASKHIFLEFVTALEPLGIHLPIELCNSPHLHLQREKHERKSSKSKAVFSRKRKSREGVKDMLQKRNWKVTF